jgi:chromosome segregation ATPase
MHPIREDEEDVLERLEARLDSVSGVVSRLKEKNAELEHQLRAAVSARESSESELLTVREEAAQLKQEVETLRSRQKQAAGRIKTLLSQVEQMDLLSEG